MQEDKKPPLHGEPYDYSNDDPNYTPPEPPEEDPPKAPEKDPVQELRDQVMALTGQITSLQGQLAAAKAAANQETPPKNDPYEDIEEQLFKDPASVLKGLEERIITTVTRTLEGSYRKDQGEREFWNEFYQQHPDLKPDDDLVKAVLQSNLSTLGNLPVSQATERLAALTRDRISRYTKTPRQRPRVEGSSPPSPPPPKKQEEKPVTLSDVIRNRRASRRGQAA